MAACCCEWLKPPKQQLQEASKQTTRLRLRGHTEGRNEQDGDGREGGGKWEEWGGEEEGLYYPLLVFAGMPLHPVSSAVRCTEHVG